MVLRKLKRQMSPLFSFPFRNRNVTRPPLLKDPVPPRLTQQFWFMRILLQSFETGLYLDTSGDWTSTLDLARSFPDIRQAADFKSHHRLASTFVVVLPEPALPVDATGAQAETIRRTQEPANPFGRRAKMTREGRSAQRRLAMLKAPKGASDQPCSISV